jgi:hypothetical protein
VAPPVVIGPSESPPPDATRGRSPSPEHVGRQTNRALGWIAVAIGGEAAAVALVTSAIMLRQSSIRNDHCDAQHVCSQAGLDANTQLSQLGGWNTAAYFVAAVSLGLGVYLLLTNPSDRAVAEVGVGPSGATLAGSF